MKVEVPEFNKCCFCIPLRYGLLVWGYIRAVTGVILFTTTIAILTFMISMWSANPHKLYVPYFLFLGISMGLLIVDMTFSIIFIVGGHAKNTRLLKIYYGYCIVLIVLMTLLFISLTAFELYSELRHPYTREISPALMSLMIRSKIASGLVNIVFQLYFIFMLRTEILKLENNCKFRFVNNATEAECSLEVNEGKLNEPTIESINKINVAILNNKEKDITVGEINANGKYTKI